MWIFLLSELNTVYDTLFTSKLLYALLFVVQVSNVLTPFRIFCAIFGTFLVFLLTDYLRYKPIMILNGLAGMLAYICLMSSPTTIGLKVCGIDTIYHPIVVFLNL